MGILEDHGELAAQQLGALVDVLAEVPLQRSYVTLPGALFLDPECADINFNIPDLWASSRALFDGLQARHQEHVKSHIAYSTNLTDTDENVRGLASRCFIDLGTRGSPYCCMIARELEAMEDRGEPWEMTAASARVLANLGNAMCDQWQRHRALLERLLLHMPAKDYKKFGCKDPGFWHQDALRQHIELYPAKVQQMLVLLRDPAKPDTRLVAACVLGNLSAASPLVVTAMQLLAADSDSRVREQALRLGYQALCQAEEAEFLMPGAWVGALTEVLASLVGVDLIPTYYDTNHIYHIECRNRVSGIEQLWASRLARALGALAAQATRKLNTDMEHGRSLQAAALGEEERACNMTQAQELFSEMDTQRSGSVSFAEFNIWLQNGGVDVLWNIKQGQGDRLFAYLASLDHTACRCDYYDTDLSRWDVQGLRSDIDVIKAEAASQTVALEELLACLETYEPNLAKRTDVRTVFNTVASFLTIASCALLRKKVQSQELQSVLDTLGDAAVGEHTVATRAPVLAASVQDKITEQLDCLCARLRLQFLRAIPRERLRPPLRCPFCPGNSFGGFMCDMSFAEHLKHIHNQMSMPMRCPYCIKKNKQFANMRNWLAHRDAVHDDMRAKPNKQGDYDYYMVSQIEFDKVHHTYLEAQDRTRATALQNLSRGVDVIKRISRDALGSKEMTFRGDENDRNVLWTSLVKSLQTVFEQKDSSNEALLDLIDAMKEVNAVYNTPYSRSLTRASLVAIRNSACGALDEMVAEKQFLASLDLVFYEKLVVTPLRLDVELAIYAHILEMWVQANPNPDRVKHLDAAGTIAPLRVLRHRYLAFTLDTLVCKQLIAKFEEQLTTAGLTLTARKSTIEEHPPRRNSSFRPRRLTVVFTIPNNNKASKSGAHVSEGIPPATQTPLLDAAPAGTVNASGAGASGMSA
ncbi:hypothetical protein CYMTET_49350 [Cymbomonas tetramitiformis]|uniref:EF-hand domain-containing protein n=1 Tax=Cymbomonas tetramitiformis TaxID=36881 RepID=A0AAE0BQD9_9CHLO|nr:hypothetical protein CYMTET_49350 [Cymbomonas tetramitiformis]